MAITKERLEELIKESVTVYSADKTVNYPIPIFLRDGENAVVNDNELVNSVKVIDKIENLYETQEECLRHYKYHAGGNRMISEMQFLLNDVQKQKGLLTFSKLPIKHKYLFMSEGTYIKLKDHCERMEQTPIWISPSTLDEYIYGLKIVIAELPDMKFVLGTEGM